MKASSIPAKFAIPFANSAGAGFSNPIPQASQIGIVGGAASLVDGFPPITFLPVGAGGIPPWGRDFNGLLNQSTAWNRWAAAGGLPKFDSSFSTAIGGYPFGSILSAASGVTVGSPQGGNHLWFSTVDDNTVNPDTTFNSSNWVPVPGIIDTNVSYTVGGTGAQFTNLIAAVQYLGRFFITHNGTATLQLSAGVFNYSATIFMDHPQNSRIILQGATMLAAVPTTDAGYAANGSAPATRATDAATNIAMLRTKFATELHFTGGAGLEIDGFMLQRLDAILFTGDGTIGGGGDGQGTACSCQGATSSPANGLAFYNFGGFGFTFINGASVEWVGTGPVVCIGNVNDGINANTGSAVVFSGPVITMQNGTSGLFANSNGIISASTMYAECNGLAGINVFQGKYAHTGGHVYRNANYGLSSQVGSAAIGDGADYGAGGNVNLLGPIFSGDGSFVRVIGATNTAGSSPAVGVVGNNNSLIANT